MFRPGQPQKSVFKQIGWFQTWSNLLRELRLGKPEIVIDIGWCRGGS